MEFENYILSDKGCFYNLNRFKFKWNSWKLILSEESRDGKLSKKKSIVAVIRIEVWTNFTKWKLKVMIIARNNLIGS